jgi:hypothetical protein
MSGRRGNRTRERTSGRIGIAGGIDLMGLFLQTLKRERRHMLDEFVQVKDLMPLLMKSRNRQKWSAQDRRELRMQLKRLSHLSPYIALVVLPGGFAMLPVLAWWLDRRRARRLPVRTRAR